MNLAHLTALCADAGLRGEDAQTAISSYLGGGELLESDLATLASFPPSVRAAKLTAHYGSDGARVAAIVLSADAVADDWTMDDAREVVTVTRAKQRAEYRDHAERMLQVTSPIAAITNLLMELGEHADALDYAEMRLSEMRAQLEKLADGVDRDAADAHGAYRADMQDHAREIREVARA